MLTILITIALTAATTASILYFKVIKPLKEEVEYHYLDNRLQASELIKLRTIQEDLLKWVDIEASPRTAQAIKQRFKERMR